MRNVKPRTTHDYLALFSRRRLWILTTLAAFSGIAILVAKLMPPIYQSGSTILIRPREVPTEFVKSLSVLGPDERLRAVERTILSRTNLLKIFDDYGTSLLSYRGLNDDQKIAKLKKRIDIKTTSERREDGYPTTTDFYISYKDQDPKTTQQITARLAALFIAQDTRVREKQISSTTEFLSKELQKVEEKLRQSERELQAQTGQYRKELPSQLSANLHMLDQLQFQKSTMVEALGRKTSAEMDLQRQLSDTPETIPQSALKTDKTALTKEDLLLNSYVEQEQKYRELLQVYKPVHPDVVRARQTLEQLRKVIPADQLSRISTASAAGQPLMVPNPAYRSLTLQLKQVKGEIVDLQDAKKRIESDMISYMSRLDNTPQVGQQMQIALRAHDEMTKEHEDLKGKLQSAQMAENLETGELGSQFIIIDPANYPLEPISPKPITLIAVGLILSLALGLGVAIVVDTFDQRIWTQHDLERHDARVLVEIPTVSSNRDLVLARKNRLHYAVVILLISGIYLAGLFYLYQNPSSVRRLLDPVVETIITKGSTG